MDKKGAVSTIGKLIVTAAVVTFLVLALVKYGYPMIKSIGKTTTCGVVGKLGVCIPESQDCSEAGRNRMGCDDYPDRPVCCTDPAVVADATATRYCVCYTSSERTGIEGFESYQNSQECESRCAKSVSYFCRTDNDAVAVCVNSLEINKPIMCYSINGVPDGTCYPTVQACWASGCELCTFGSGC